MTDKKYRKYEGAPASMEFIRALSGGGSHDVECGYCGRQHYAVGDLDNYYDTEKDYEDRVNDLNAEADANPDGVLVSNDNCIHYKDIDGKMLVVDCPCNGLRHYENFIWGHRRMFAQYLSNVEKKIDADLADLRAVRDILVS